MLPNVYYEISPMCDMYPCNIGVSSIRNNELIISSGIRGIAIRNDAFSEDLEKWKEELAQNPVTVLLVLEEPIETPIPPEELAIYRALHTNTPTTTITNDEGCHMQVGYKAKPISQYNEAMTLEYLKGK